MNAAAGKGNFCRFLDALGLCYDYREAQVRFPPGWTSALLGPQLLSDSCTVAGSCCRLRMGGCVGYRGKLSNAVQSDCVLTRLRCCVQECALSLLFVLTVCALL